MAATVAGDAVVEDEAAGDDYVAGDVGAADVDAGADAGLLDDVLGLLPPHAAAVAASPASANAPTSFERYR